MPTLAAHRTSEQPTSVEEVSKIFHRLNRLLPENQSIVSVAPSAKVKDVLDIMKRYKFSQLPVVEGSEVLGLFSYRSFSEKILKFRISSGLIGDLPVEEFTESIKFARGTDEFSSIFENLDNDNAVLVGEPDRLQGIVTSMDVLRYLYGIASPFVLLAEVELTIRALICLAVNGELLEQCIRIAWTSVERDIEDLPTELCDLTFNDYILIISHGNNWEYFFPVFGGMRQRVRTKLEDLRDLRNTVFHFKKELTWEEHEYLAELRDWLLRIARIADARNRGGE